MLVVPCRKDWYDVLNLLVLFVRDVGLACPDRAVPWSKKCQAIVKAHTGDPILKSGCQTLRHSGDTGLNSNCHTL